MNTLYRHWLKAALFAVFVLPGAALAQNTLTMNVYYDSTGTYAPTDPWCDPATNPSTCLPQPGIELCLDPTTICATTDSNGAAVIAYDGDVPTNLFVCTVQDALVTIVAGSDNTTAFPGDPDLGDCVRAENLTGTDVRTMYVEITVPALSVTDNPDPIIAGLAGGVDNLLLSWALSNYTGAEIPEGQLEVRIGDFGALPDGVSFGQALVGSGTYLDGVWTLGTIANGATPTLGIRLSVASDAQTCTDCIELTGDLFDVSDPGNPVDLGQSAQSLTSVDRESDLAIRKAGPASAIAGEQFDYTITVANLGPSDADGVTVTDLLDANLTYISDTAPNGCTGAPNLVCDLGDIAAPVGSPVPVVFTITVEANSNTPNPANVVNVASVPPVPDVPNDPDPSNNRSARVTTNITRESAISITKTADPSPLVAQGGTQTYTIEVSNGGPSDASNLFVTETLPAGLTVTAMNPPGICNGTSGTVTCTLPGPVAAGDSYKFTLEMDIPDDFPLGTIKNTSRVECTDPACSTNTTPEDSAVLAEVETRVVVAVPADGTALIAVQKFFRDGNDETPVTLTLECTTGSYAPATVVVNPDEFAPGSAFEHIFVITDIPTGAPNPCTVVEEPVAGYDATYICGQDGSTSTVDDTLCNGFADFTPGTTACGWLDVATGDSNLCGIFNDPAPVEVAVTKVWDVSNTGGDYFSRDAEIKIGCNAEIINSTWEKGNWSYKKFYLDDSDYTAGVATVTVQVIPEFPSSECFAVEDDVDSAVEVTSDCGSWNDGTMEVSVGEGDSCTITNTMFFEGIPTLNQYGLALMALLMLGIGMVGFRRFA